MVTTSILYEQLSRNTDNVLHDGRWYGMILRTGHSTGYIRYVDAWVNGTTGSYLNFTLYAKHVQADGTVLRTSPALTYDGSGSLPEILQFDFGCAFEVAIDEAIVLETADGSATQAVKIPIGTGGVPTNTQSMFKNNDGTISFGSSEAQLMRWDTASTSQTECGGPAPGGGAVGLPPPPYVLVGF